MECRETVQVGLKRTRNEVRSRSRAPPKRKKDSVPEESLPGIPQFLQQGIVDASNVDAGEAIPSPAAAENLCQHHDQAGIGADDVSAEAEDNDGDDALAAPWQDEDSEAPHNRTMGHTKLRAAFALTVFLFFLYYLHRSLGGEPIIEFQLEKPKWPSRFEFSISIHYVTH